MEYNEADYLQLSGLQHFSFCRRQWALIHVEQQWQDNLRTVEGDILHERFLHRPRPDGQVDILDFKQIIHLLSPHLSEIVELLLNAVHDKRDNRIEHIIVGLSCITGPRLGMGQF